MKVIPDSQEEALAMAIWGESSPSARARLFDRLRQSVFPYRRGLDRSDLSQCCLADWENLPSEVRTSLINAVQSHLLR